MLRTCICALVVAVTVQLTLVPTASAVGVGFVVGEPTGLSLQWRTRPGHAMNASLAWSFGPRDRARGTLDFVGESQFDPQGPVLFYYGIGVAVGATEGRWREEGDASAGIRFPVGLSAYPAPRFGVFFELAPTIRLAPESRFELTGGMGARYYF